MKSLADINLLEILPEPLLADEKIVAAAKALNLQLQQLSQDIKYALHLPRIDDLPHEVLDQLAWQYDCMFYEPTTMNLETKRQIIKNTILQHKTLGTRYAVEQMLSVFTSNAQVQEFFEYEGGKPYHFKIKLTGLRDLEDSGDTILRLINLSKNTRSWLSDFDFNLKGDLQKLYVAMPHLKGGVNRYDLNGHLVDTENLRVIQAQFAAGTQAFNISSSNVKILSTPRAGFFKIVAGRIQYDCDRTEIDENAYAFWLMYLKKFWRQFNLNPVIKYYKDTKDDIDDDFDEETFEGNFLKLFFDFKKSDESRLIVLPFPKNEVTAADINAIPAENMLLSRKKNFSNRIFRSVLVKKTVTRLEIGGD